MKRVCTFNLLPRGRPLVHYLSKGRSPDICWWWNAAVPLSVNIWLNYYASSWCVFYTHMMYVCPSVFWVLDLNTYDVRKCKLMYVESCVCNVFMHLTQIHRNIHCKCKYWDKFAPSVCTWPLDRYPKYWNHIAQPSLCGNWCHKLYFCTISR